MSSNTSERTTVISDQTNTENSQPKTSSSSKGELVLIVVGVIFVVLLWLGYPFLLNLLDSTKQNQPQIVIPYQIDAMLKTEPEQSETIDEEKTKFQKIGDTYGTYGDSYGSLNTLFSGLAFTFLVASLFLQRKELHAQRLEIEDQKDEIRKSNIIAEAQRKITEQQANLIRDQITEAQKQNFYSLFFQFLEEKNLKFKNLKIISRRPQFPDLIGDMYVSRFANSWLNELPQPFVPPVPDENGIVPSEYEYLIIRLEKNYTTTCENNRTSFEEYFYFEYFVFLLNFISKNSSVHNTEVVIDTFLSRLNFDETICMACYAVLRNQELKSYIEHYSLLRNINSKLLGDDHMDSLKQLYSKQAFNAPKNANLDVHPSSKIIRTTYSG